MTDSEGAPGTASPRDRRLSVESEFGWFLASSKGLQPAPFVDHAFIRALEECWIRPESLVLPVARYLAAKWPKALTGSAAAGEPQLIEVVRDPVLLTMLRQTPAATPGLERLLARVRYGALRAVMAGDDIEALVPTMAALAIRGWHSGYALTLPLDPRHDQASAEEAALVAQLSEQLEQGTREAKELVAALAVSAAYGPPEPQHLHAALEMGDPAVRLIEQRVAAPRNRQLEIARSLTPATSIDPSSAPVAEQYETHPYPAWVGEAADGVMLPPPVQSALGPDGADAVRSVLVAGCGTGQHAVVAARAWRNADILAIDISRSSLAYAIDQRPADLRHRLRFELADLLQIEQLGRRFQVIETMGVLHHLAEPAAGLQALTRVLEPGGVIGIGLYSAAARSGFAAIRDHFEGKDMRSDEAIRRFRAWALAELKAPEVLYSPDFYSIGGCRDTFFHVREHCYSLDEVGNMLDRAGLKLLAVQVPPMAEKRLGSLPGPDDLAGWAAAEQEHKDLFLGMYELWAQAGD